MVSIRHGGRLASQMDDRNDVTSTPEATGLTIADLEALPEDMAIRNLIDGELFVTSATTTRHQRVVRIIAALIDHVREHGGEVLTAPCAVRLSDRDVPEPDVLHLRSDRLDRIGERSIVGAPDLVWIAAVAEGQDAKTIPPPTRRSDPRHC